MDQIAKESDQGNLPSFTITTVTVLLPVVLMLLKTFADVVLPAEHIVRQWMDLIGHPITALLAALLLAFYTFGAARGFNRQQIMKMLEQSGSDRGDRADRGCRWRLQADAGGHWRGQCDRADGRAGGDFADHAGLAGSGGNPHRHRFRHGRHHHRRGHRRTGDRLVPGVNRELLVLATGAGSLILSHVNDAGFWLVKQYFNMTVAETFKTRSMMETILSIVGIIFIMLLSLVV